MQDLKKEIDTMSQSEMARLWRFAPSSSPFFQGEIGNYFKKVFEDKGGFTSEISKKLGWN